MSEAASWFKVVGEVEQIEVIAVGRSVRERVRLRKTHGGTRWRKLKGIATVELPDGRNARADVHWYEAHGIGRRDQATSRLTTMAKPARHGLCVENRGYPAALELRKIYRLVDDPSAQARGLVRVVDESGEDYLYPERFFVPIEVPREAARAFSRKSA